MGSRPLEIENPEVKPHCLGMVRCCPLGEGMETAG